MKTLAVNKPNEKRTVVMIVDSPVAISIFTRDMYFTNLCYLQGGLEHTGAILFKHYQSDYRLNALARSGDIDLLHRSLSECLLHDYAEHSCNAARFPPNMLKTRAEVIATGLGLSIHYLWDGDQWLVRYQSLVFESLRVALRRLQADHSTAPLTKKMKKSYRKPITSSYRPGNRKQHSEFKKASANYLRRRLIC